MLVLGSASGVSAEGGGAELSLEEVQHPYDAAARIATGRGEVAGVVIEGRQMTAAALRLVAAMRRGVPAVPVWVAGDTARISSTAQARVQAALQLGALPWRKDEVTKEVTAPPPAPKTPPEKRQTRTDPAADDAILIRPTRATPPRRSSKADKDGTKASAATGAPESLEKVLEQGPAERYDALSGQQVLSDDELKALLEPTRENDGESSQGVSASEGGPG